MIELYGARTGNCFRAAIALEEAGLSYRTVHVDLRHGEHKGGPYLSLNPSGTVPTLVDHGFETPFVLSQSNAIMFHASSLVPGRLMPMDSFALSVAIERWFYFITDVLGPNFDAFLVSRNGGAGAATLASRSLAALEAAERFVLSAPFMAGNQFTLADISAVSLTSAVADRVDWDRLPSLARWYEKVMQRPGVQKGLAAFG